MNYWCLYTCIGPTDFVQYRVAKLGFLQECSSTTGVNTAIAGDIQLLEVTLEKAAIVACKLRRRETWILPQHASLALKINSTASLEYTGLTCVMGGRLDIA